MEFVSEFRNYFVKNIKAFNYLIFFLSVFSLFLWEVNLYHSFTSRYLIIFLIVFNFLYYKKKDLGIYLLILIIAFFILIHLHLNTDEISNRQYVSIVFLILTLCISFKFKIFFTKFFFEISTIYISLINLLIISGVILYGFEIYDYNKYKNGLCAINYSRSFQDFIRYFFIEPSHLAFLSTPIIVSYVFFIQKRNNLILLNYLFFVILIVTNYLSASLLLSTIISILLILIFNYKDLKKIKKNKLLISIFLFYLILFLSISTCNIRVTQFLKLNLLYDLNEIGISKDIQKLLPINDDEIDKLQTDKNFKFTKKIDKTTEEIEKTFRDNKDIIVPYTIGDTDLKRFKEAIAPVEINMSTIVHVNSFAVTLNAIKNRPFGFGFQNYQDAHNNFHQQNYFSFPEMSFYNYNDGASNFSKSLSEFGVFNILFLILFLLYLIKSEDELPIKVFLISILITQSIRGAGYFNGSFLFFLSFAILNSGYKLEMFKFLKNKMK